ncbi:hypothetical protein E2C01_015484 [Portunus trituberculatus]|uniref:Uncharacterized protein n=1 Tax=Portunus trituberculatus TaxID=210409 RepID=A0A5B7DN18_PORTR|nr:hypothetical protein [Portunus trituberculatus]
MTDAHHDAIEAVRQSCSAAYTEPKIKGRARSVRPSPAHHQLVDCGRHLHQLALLSPGSAARIPHVPNSTLSVYRDGVREMRKSPGYPHFTLSLIPHGVSYPPSKIFRLFCQHYEKSNPILKT